jgi:hypothetical protein
VTLTEHSFSGEGRFVLLFTPTEPLNASPRPFFTCRMTGFAVAVASWPFYTVTVKVRHTDSHVYGCEIRNVQAPPPCGTSVYVCVCVVGRGRCMGFLCRVGAVICCWGVTFCSLLTFSGKGTPSTRNRLCDCFQPPKCSRCIHICSPVGHKLQGYVQALHNVLSR